MQRKEIEQIYIKKIKQLRKYDESYFGKDKPTVSDSEYDNLKKKNFRFRIKISIFKKLLFTK